jgi:hypothetical protein
MGPRTGLSTTLIAAGATFLIAIALGSAVGGRIIGQVTAPIASLLPVPLAVVRAVPSTKPEPPAEKEPQVMSVATDPGFPDPRVTPEPEPTPTPVRRARLITPPPEATGGEATLSPEESIDEDEAPGHGNRYSPPPLPVPISTPSSAPYEQGPSPGPQPSSSPRGGGFVPAPYFTPGDVPVGAKP